MFENDRNFIYASLVAILILLAGAGLIKGFCIWNDTGNEKLAQAQELVGTQQKWERTAYNTVREYPLPKTPLFFKGFYIAKFDAFNQQMKQSIAGWQDSLKVMRDQVEAPQWNKIDLDMGDLGHFTFVFTAEEILEIARGGKIYRELYGRSSIYGKVKMEMRVFSGNYILGNDFPVVYLTPRYLQGSYVHLTEKPDSEDSVLYYSL